MSALLEMIAVIRLHSPQLFAADRVVDPAALVRIDGDWAAIRHAAQGCLVTFGVSPLGLRAEDIDVAK